VADAAEAIAIATEKDIECVPINVGTGIETSIADLTNIIAEAVGYEGEVAWDTSKPDGQPKRYLDVSRAKELLGFEASIDLADGIRETVEWYKQNPVT
jgi:nucleoside-diphosphate-sugar epimerase